MCVVLGGPSSLSSTIIYTGPVTDMGNPIPDEYFTAYQFKSQDFSADEEEMRFMILHFPAMSVDLVDTSDYKSFLSNIAQQIDRSNTSRSAKSVNRQQVGMYDAFYGVDIESLIDSVVTNYPSLKIQDDIIDFYSYNYPQWILIGLVWNSKSEQTLYHPIALRWTAMPGFTANGYEYYFPGVDNGLPGNSSVHNGLPDLKRNVDRDHLLLTGLVSDHMFLPGMRIQKIKAKLASNIPKYLVQEHIMYHTVKENTSNGDFYSDINSGALIISTPDEY